MSVVVNAALAGPKTSRYSNVYGALSNNGVLPNYGRTDMLGSGSSALSRLTTLIDSLGGILWLPNQHNYVLTTDTAVAPVGDPVGYMGSHRQNLPENFVKNSMMVGGGVGVLPTGWTNAGLTAVGVTAAITGVGTDIDGTYLEFSFSGTASGNGTIFIFPNGSSASADHPAAKAAQLWSTAIKVKGISGTQRSMGVVCREISGAAFGSFSTSGSLSPVNGTLSTYQVNRVLGDVGTDKLSTYFQFSIGAGQVWDQVIRIYAPQLERGKPTAFTPTYGSAITRGANFEPAWQDTTANKPLLGVDADGKGILTYDGSNDFFRTGIQTPEAGYIAGVWNLTGAAGSAYGMFASSAGITSGARQGARFIRASTNELNMSRDDNTATTVLASTEGYLSGKAVIDAHYAVGSASLRKNGGDEVTSATARTATSTNYFRIGASGNGGDAQTEFFPGAMLAQVWIPGARPGATIEAEIRRLLAEITAVSGVV